MSVARVPILGSWVDPLTPGELVEAVAALVAAGAGGAVANHNLHSLALWRRGDLPAAWYEDAAIIHADGMSVIWIARLAGLPMARRHRTTYVDWLPQLLQRADCERWRVFHLGGEPEHLPRLQAEFARRWPGIALAAAHGFFREDGVEDEAMAAAVAAHDPQVVLVGMGMPRQERWLQRWRQRFPRAVLLPCGAAAKYLTGAERTPPRWLGRLGLEWLYRLAGDPRRLWHRYLVEPLALVLPVAAFVYRQRRALRRRT